MEDLIRQIKQKVQISLQLEEAIQAAFQKKGINKNEFLLLEHQYDRNLYFINKGTFKTFYFD